MSASLWSQVGACFDTDDGSLPGIEITQLAPAGVSAIYRMLRERSRLVGDSTFWCFNELVDKPVDSVPDAALRVATQRAEAFHVLISGVMIREVVLPDLGVFVWPNSIELDYRMGSAWGRPEVAGFFELLKECCAHDPAAIVVPTDFEGPPYPDRFSQAWTAYLRGAG